MARHIQILTILVALAGSGAWVHPAWASFHFWKIDEIYSNASGTVQFVELSDTHDGETKLNPQTLISHGHTFTFPADLPDGTPTAGHHLLLATPGYSALSGVTPADFSLGVNNFFSTSGDTLTYAGGFDAVTFTAANLPTDGLNSINRATPVAALVSAVNSATDLAGTSKAIPPWENQNNRLDVNGIGGLTPIDALLVINELIANGIHALAPPSAGHAPPPFLDVSGDNSVSPVDAIQVINALIAGPLVISAKSQAAIGAEPQSVIMASAVVSVPEPASESLALIAAGLLAALAWARNRRRSRGATQTRVQAL
jgi:dockerin type I repeat protein/PEP-CTERM motif-containing protein